jgi:hypothetical protein
MFANVNVKFEAMREEIKRILNSIDERDMTMDSAIDELLNLHSVSNPLPTKEDVIKEGDKQIKDWLMGNSFEERTAYRIAFRRSFEYVLRFIK